MKYLSSKIIFVHNFTLKITSARFNKGPVVSLVEKNKGPGYKTSKYGMQFFSHNFWTINALKPIKGSKDSDFNLVSTDNLSRKIPFSSWGSGPDNLGQNGLKPTTLVTLPTKTQNFKIKKKSKLEDSLYLLRVITTLAQLAGELQCC